MVKETVNSNTYVIFDNRPVVPEEMRTKTIRTKSLMWVQFISKKIALISLAE